VTAARHPTAILVLCCLAQFLGLLDVTIVNVALPAMRADLGFSAAGLQWVVNAYTLALAGFLLLGGRAADLLGRREVFAAGLALFGIASLAGGLAQDDAMLIAARAAQGLGGAIVAPTGLSILATTFAEGPERNRALGWWGTVGGLGGASGALVGGLVTDAFSWRWILLANAPLCLAAALFALRVVPSTGRRPGGSFDLPGAATATAGLVLLTYGIVAFERHGLGAAAPPLAAGVGLLGAFLAIEGRLAAAPLVPLRIFRARALSGANVVLLCLGAVTFSMWFLVTLYLQQTLGLSAVEAGLAFAPVSLTIAASTRLGARLSGRFGPGRVMAAGMAALAVGMLMLADGSSARDVLVATLVCAAGIGCSFVPATIAAGSSVRAEDAGLASGVLNTAYQVGSSLGLALLAAIADGGFRAAFVAGACIALAGSAVALLVVAREPVAVGHRRRLGAGARVELGEDP
jgi:EmrB/QacA subfamily drug resistance transporter